MILIGTGTRAPILEANQENYLKLLKVLNLAAIDIKSITGIIHGGASSGGDMLFHMLAQTEHIPHYTIKPKWGDLTQPYSLILTNSHKGQYDHNAAYRRNGEICDYALHTAYHDYSDMLLEHTIPDPQKVTLVALWDGQSSGTADTIEAAKWRGIQTWTYNFLKDSLTMCPAQLPHVSGRSDEDRLLGHIEEVLKSGYASEGRKDF